MHSTESGRHPSLSSVWKVGNWSISTEGTHCRLSVAAIISDTFTKSKKEGLPTPNTSPHESEAAVRGWVK